MFILLKRPLSYLVLYSFFFQTLWPSVVFARVDVPLGAAWQDNPCGLTFKIIPLKDDANLVRIQAFANPKEEWIEEVASPPKQAVASVPSIPDASLPPKVSPPSKPPAPSDAALERLKKLLDRVVNVRTLQMDDKDKDICRLYNDLTVTVDGISWAFGGIAFALDWNWNVFATGDEKEKIMMAMAVKICTHGNVEVDNVFVKQLLAKGKNITIRGTGGMERFDAWATGDGKTPGMVRITEGSSQIMDQLYIHQGKTESHGQLTIKESLQQKGEFDNHGTLSLERNAVVQGGKVFSNYGTVEGEKYQIKSALIRNESVGAKKATMKTTQSLTLEAQKLEQKGDIAAPSLDLSAVDEIEDKATSTIKATQLKTALKKSWNPQGRLETEEWLDESNEAVFIQNQGTILSNQKTSLKARFRTLQGGKSNLTGVSFRNSADRSLPLMNEGDTVLRKVEDLGGHRKDIENRVGGSLVFLECGTSASHEPRASYVSDANVQLQSGGLHLGTIKNDGTFGLGSGTYRVYGTFTNTASGVHEVLPGQNLLMQDFVNDGVVKAPSGYLVDQRGGIFTKLGKVLVKGKLITQISERAVRNKTGSTTWKHTGHIETDDWEDESDKTIIIENTGTIITRKSATLSAQFLTGKGGFSDLRGLSLAKPLSPNQAWVNKGKTILRKVRSLGEKERSIVNEKSGELAFLEGQYKIGRAHV